MESQAAYGALGQDEPSTLSILEQYAPAVTAITEQATDPYRQAAILRAQLRAAILRGASAQQIEILQGKLAAAERRIQLRSEQESTVRTWQTLGTLGIVAVVILAGSLALFGLRRAVA